MTTAELKSTLHKDIDKIENNEQLEALISITNNYILNPGEPELNKEQIKRLEISRKQAANGEFISNDDVEKEMNEWLKK